MQNILFLCLATYASVCAMDYPRDAIEHNLPHAFAEQRIDIRSDNTDDTSETELAALYNAYPTNHSPRIMVSLGYLQNLFQRSDSQEGTCACISHVSLCTCLLGMAAASGVTASIYWLVDHATH